MIGERIRQARTAAGLSQGEVVARLGASGFSLTKGGLSKYERGGSLPKPTLLRGLAQILGVDTAFFLEEPAFAVRWLAFRKAPRLSTSLQDQVKSLAETRIEMILGLRDSLRVPRPAPHPRFFARVAEDAERAAELAREHWQLGTQAIESVTTAIEDGGGVVVETTGMTEHFDGLAGWADASIPVVVVSGDAPDDRRRFSLAHEIGHLFMEVDPALDLEAEEKLAHRFAAAFLVPAETARRELGERRRKLDFQELEILKVKHGLSMQAWICRAADLGIIEDSYCKTLLSTMSARGWRRHEPVALEAKERSLRLQQLLLRALAEGLLSQARAERILPGIHHELAPGDRNVKSGARAFRRLSSAEQERSLERAAAELAPAYRPGGRLAGFESLAEEDYLEPIPAE